METDTVYWPGILDGIPVDSSEQKDHCQLSPIVTACRGQCIIQPALMDFVSLFALPDHFAVSAPGPNLSAYLDGQTERLPVKKKNQRLKQGISIIWS
jgi:hypothetical protein